MNEDLRDCSGCPVYDMLADRIEMFNHCRERTITSSAQDMAASERLGAPIQDVDEIPFFAHVGRDMNAWASEVRQQLVGYDSATISDILKKVYLRVFQSVDIGEAACKSVLIRFQETCSGPRERRLYGLVGKKALACSSKLSKNNEKLARSYCDY